MEPSIMILEKFGLAVFLIVFIIGVFVYLLKTLVSQWTEQSRSFTTVIQNHLHSNTDAMTETCKLLTSMNKDISNGFSDMRESHRRERDEHEGLSKQIKELK